MLIDVLLIIPEDDKDNYDEHEQYVRDLVDIKGIESPNLQTNHQLELNREGRPSCLLMKPDLTEFTPKSPRR